MDTCRHLNVSYKLTLMALLAIVLYAAGVRAEESGTAVFTFNGFGTAGVVHSSEDQADFTSHIFQPAGAGYSHTWSTSVDSLIGAQVSVNASPKLSAVVQVISEYKYDGSYRPHLEWANIKYQFTPDFSVRIGRTLLPAFLNSETRKVGYTYPWVRPPSEVYRIAPLTSIDGMDVSYRLHFGELTNTIRMNVGSNETKLVNNNATAETDRSRGISYTGEYGPLTVRITYQKTWLTITAVNTVFDAFREFGPQGVALADKYNFDNKPFSFRVMGASYDPGKWFVMTEWGQSESKSVLGKRTSWYISGGYRSGKFTPYVTFARATADNLSDPGLTVSSLPPFLAGSAIALNTALNSSLRAKPVQNNVSVGMRWDFIKNTDLKLQFDHTNIGPGSSGTLSNTQPGFQAGGKVNVFSATIDFVF